MAIISIQIFCTIKNRLPSQT